MFNEYGNPIVEWPKHYKPLPDGYRVIQLDSGHYMWEKVGCCNSNGGPLEGLMSWDRYWVRRCAFKHWEESCNDANDSDV
jgi:hypothetical protein